MPAAESPRFESPGLEPPGLQPSQTGTDTLVEEELDTRRDYRYDEGDHERFAHYAPKDKIVEAMVTGNPIRALCGKIWVPSRDPGRFPVCPVCKEIWQGLPPGGDGPDS
jgi:DUF3039 family protein